MFFQLPKWQWMFFLQVQQLRTWAAMTCWLGSTTACSPLSQRWKSFVLELHIASLWTCCFQVRLKFSPWIRASFVDWWFYFFFVCFLFVLDSVARYCLESKTFCFSSGTIPMKRIKFNTNLEHEYINNFKALQAAFKKVNVDKVSVRNIVLRWSGNKVH